MGRLWVYDTESDGLLPELTKFHCLVFSTVDEKEIVIFCDYPSLPQQFIDDTHIAGTLIKYKHIHEFNAWLHTDVSGLICHYMVGFDLPAMEMMGLISGFDISPDSIDGMQCRLYDTVALSRALHPDRRLPSGCPAKVYNIVTGKMDTVGAHGLQAWGMRVAKVKPTVHDWRHQKLEVYVNRCVEDVKINVLTWKALLKEAAQGATGSKNGWNDAIPLIQESFFAMCVQERTGVPFDIAAAEKLVIRIDGMMDDIAADVEPALPLRVLPKAQQLEYPAAPYKDDGELSVHGWGWIRKLGYELNEDAFIKESFPAKPFKKDGTISAHGSTFCANNFINVDDADAVQQMQSLISKMQIHNDVQPLDADIMDIAIADLKSERVPILKEPMKLGNQKDIKEWLYTNASWSPTIWGTKNATEDVKKKPYTDAEIVERIEAYIITTKEAVWRRGVYKEMSVNFETYPQDKLVERLKRKARFLVTSPKFKDERGELCPNLERVNGAMAAQIVKWLSLRNRRSTLRAIDEKKETGWLNNPRLKVDGRLPAGNSGLTNTHRQKHRCVVNVPKADPKVLMGKEFRSLFYAPDGYVFLGFDAAALEARVAGWYAQLVGGDNGDYAERVLGQGGTDFHEENAKGYTKAANITIGRSQGKNITYAVMYGATAPKIASMVGVKKEVGQSIIDAFWNINFGLKKTREKLEVYWEKTGKRYIRSVDGRKIYTRSKHSLMNCLFQSTGAIVMDLTASIMRKKIREEQLCATHQRVLYQHDEYQHLIKKETIQWKEFSTEKETEDFDDGKVWSNIKKIRENKYVIYYSRIGEIATESILQAGEELGSPIPITASYDIGKNWSGTH